MHDQRPDAGIGSLAAPAMAMFTAAIFTSACLLFAIQPLFTKLALPLLGGAPNVWNTAMVFFQGTLLLGYLYSHLITSRLSFRAQVGVHAAILAAGLIFLPFAIPEGWTPPEAGAQSLWLIGLMAAAIGVPFFALSANAPLLQRWFSYTRHKDAHDPYFLYAASNVGSIAALLSYPVFFEPAFGLKVQATIWSGGYLLLIVLIIAAAVIAMSWRAPAAEAHKEKSSAAAGAPTMRDRLIWVALAFAPSGLMLAVTTELTTNITPAPMLWIVPLTLYLLSFVFVFGRSGAAIHTLVRGVAPIGLLFVAFVTSLTVRGLGLSLGAVSATAISICIYLAGFFLIAMSCHGELAARRPAASHLTEFYLWMSLGGVLGGIFVALLAPVLFNSILEYPILLVVSAFLIAAGYSGGEKTSRARRWGPVVIGASTLAAWAVSGAGGPSSMAGIAVIGAAAFAATAAAWSLRKSAVWFAAGIASVIVTFSIMRETSASVGAELVSQDRSFFGVTKVYRTEFNGHDVHTFVHGTTIHNVQIRSPEERRIPFTYFSDESVFGSTLEHVRRLQPALNIGVIGLGAGSLACQAEPGDTWTFYEIDPLVVRTAEDADRFSFLADCAPDAGVRIGDARLSIVNEVEAGAPQYDILFIDAFSSDSIPAHLITKEALTLYRERVKDDGVIMFHTTNRYMDVSSIAIAVARDLGLDWRFRKFRPDAETARGGLIQRNDGVAVGKPEVLDAVYGAAEDWRQTPPNEKVGVWTDDYSNIIGAIMAKQEAGD